MVRTPKIIAPKEIKIYLKNLHIGLDKYIKKLYLKYRAVFYIERRSECMKNYNILIVFILNYICLFDYLFISSQMSAKPYFIGSTGILLLW